MSVFWFCLYIYLYWRNQENVYAGFFLYIWCYIWYDIMDAYHRYRYGYMVKDII